MNIESSDENIILGFFGALIGALIGYALWLFCGYFGIIPGFVGFIFAYLSVKGYMLLAGGISRKGLIICIVICVILVLLSEIGSVILHIYFDWGIHEPMEILKNIFNYISTEGKVMWVIGNTVLGIFSLFVGCFNMYFRIWKETANGAKNNVSISNQDVFEIKMPQRKDIPIGEHKKLVIGIIIAAIIYVIIMTIWGLKRF
jgi:hypothetical protein